MTYQEFALKQLKKEKYRITKPRQAVLDTLESTHKPLNAYEIANAIKKNGTDIDVSTVYRILDVYQKLKLAHFIKDKQGYLGCKDWTCRNENHCHHQFVCTSCENVVEMHIDDHEFLQNIQKKFRELRIDKHYLEFSGMCKQCH